MWMRDLAVLMLQVPQNRVLGQRRADGVAGGGGVRDADHALTSTFAISSASTIALSLRLGDLIGRHLGAARRGGRVKTSTCALVTHAQAAGAGMSSCPVERAPGRML
jgi:hypothetical protein